MENTQNPGNPGNSTQQDVSATNTAESLTDIMNTLNTSEPAPEPSNGENGKGTNEVDQKPENPKWMAQLDGESLKNEDLVKQLSKFQNIGDLAKSYSALEKKLGKSINIPGDDAAAEEIAAFYGKLGRPESAEAYSIADEKAKQFKEIAFMNNLTDKQARGMYDALAQMGAAAVQASQEEQLRKAQESDAQLRTEWGKDYGANLEFLKRGIAAYGGNSLGAKLQSSGLLYDVDVVKMFALLGRQTSEATATTKGAGDGMSDYLASRDGGMFNYKD